ncbi:molecular chaperone [Photorhabdus noenieputensis]|uniref:fimbrial biogenesis chaperone n=1 Tax=Photorhabdus noenieputensis TaxID=1208607 RepID=UPI001BD2C298|nr:molecular chaperone [Photorhabdus noenieputensis]MBS9435762.1 molecular chaperone [Photorhabdus noenieputensis]MCK3667678.1 molecular chaperone [Photorhabdus noenieputensis]
MKKLMTAMIVTGLLGCTVTDAMAGGVSIDTTRIIYQTDSHAASTSVRNSSKKAAYLMQVAVSADPERKKAAPFVVTPPLFRLEPDTQNQVRIIKTGQALPADRESLFWFTAQAIPLSPEIDNPSRQQVTGGIQIAMANTIKLMYRPHGLSVAPEQGFGSLRFKPTAEGITVTNPSPYYITFTSLKVGGQELMTKQQKENMVSPFSALSFPLKGVHYPAKVSWTVINDLGGSSSYKGEIP